MKYVNYFEWNLEELVNRSQNEVNNMINAFKNEKAENVLVIEIRDLLDKLPNTKNEIELKIKSYEILETTEDEPPYIGDMQLVDE
jgi:aspartyl/asparaginyl-tRNA synthetase